MSVAVKALLVHANFELKARVFSVSLSDIASAMENGQAWLELFVCMWRQNGTAQPSSKYPYLFSVNKQSKFLNEITLQDVINSFRSEYKLFFTCANWEKKKYWLDEKAGHVCLVEWLKKQGLTKQDTILLYPSREAILSAAHGSPDKEKLREQLGHEVARLLARKVSARRIIQFFERSEHFRELYLGDKAGN